MYQLCYKLSTIVEIIEAYQPNENCRRKGVESTIVEIIEAYQPFAAVFMYDNNLQQQKLQKLTSRAECRAGLKIYNSRNYRSLLAEGTMEFVNILIYNSRNYRSLLAFLAVSLVICESTIVEIIEAYQPALRMPPSGSNLQQQKLQKLTSRGWVVVFGHSIYNSRNYRSLLAHYIFSGKPLNIYNSRNYRSLLAYFSTNCFSLINLQQQKLQKLTSPLPLKPVNLIIYNSRNYRSLLALHET